MPTVGAFHGQFWDAKGAAAAVAARRESGYPHWQSNMQRAYTLSMAIWAVPGDALYPLRLWLKRAWGAWVRFYRLKPWTLSGEQLAVLGRATELVTSPLYFQAQREVRAAARLAEFHKPEHRLEYARAIKSDLGQAQNTFRQLRAVQGVRAAEPSLRSLEARLLVELAYHGFVETGRDHAKHVTHTKKVVAR